MQRSQIVGGVVLLVSVLAARVDAAPPRVFLLDGEHLERARQGVREDDVALAPAMKKLEQSAREAMKAGPFAVTLKERTPPSGDKHDYMSQAPYWWPDPDKPDGLPYVRKDGLRNPEIYKLTDRTQMRQMADAVETLALAWYFTGDEAFAARAAGLLRTWFIDETTRMNPHLQFGQGIPGINTGRGIGIIETVSLTSVPDSIGLLAGSMAWTDADERAMRDWFGQYLTWMLESQHGRDESAAKNNHGTYYDVQACTYALFVERPDVAKRILSEVPTKRIAVQIEPDGRQPLELERTKAWSYSVMNVRGLMLLADFGQRLGVELWNHQTPDGRTIRKALDFLAPYASGEQVWPHEQISGFRPEGGIILFRRAAQEYPDGPYAKLVAEKLPPLPPDALDQLTGPRLLANPEDSR
jgi:Alginate lyase